MPCMKRTSASVKIAPFGIVTGADIDMPAIDCCVAAPADLSADFPVHAVPRNEKSSVAATPRGLSVFTVRQLVDEVTAWSGWA